MVGLLPLGGGRHRLTSRLRSTSDHNRSDHAYRGPTVLLEIEVWRLLTDPTFDPVRGRYNLGWGTGSRKTGPAIDASEAGQLDAVLLSHHQHDDNLDSAGRGLLPSVDAVITTIAGAKRLGGDARGWRRGQRPASDA